MYYKRFNAIGVRRRFGGKEQCFSFGGTTCFLDKQALWILGCAVLKKLDDGQTEEAVRAWVDTVLA